MITLYILHILLTIIVMCYFTYNKDGKVAVSDIIFGFMFGLIPVIGLLIPLGMAFDTVVLIRKSK